MLQGRGPTRLRVHIDAHSGTSRGVLPRGSSGGSRVDRAVRRISTEVCKFSLWAVDAFTHIAGSDERPESGKAAIMLEFEVQDVDAEFRRLQHLPTFTIEFILKPTTHGVGKSVDLLPRPRWQSGKRFHPRRRVVTEMRLRASPDAVAQGRGSASSD